MLKYIIYKEKTVTKTIGHNTYSESRYLVRADCKKPSYPSLLSRKSERTLGFPVSRVKGKDHRILSGGISQIEWFRGYVNSSQGFS